MKARKISIFLFIVFSLFSMLASAETEKASRRCQKEDLIGTWDMVSVKPIHDKNDAVFYPNQRFVFQANSSMKFMASEQPFTQEWLEKFAKQIPEIDYSLSEKGLLTLTWQSRPHNESALCAYVLKDVPPEVLAKIPVGQRAHLPRKGNVTLSFLNSSGKIAYQKILRRAP